MQRNQHNKQRAVVIGGSLTGLLAARVLSDHFDQVVVIERDQLPSVPTFRSGVPQSRHAHALLVRGRTILERFFPGITSELTADGAVEVNVTRDFLLHNQMRFMPRIASPQLSTLTMTRELLEWNVRSHVYANQRIEIVQEYEVVNLISAPEESLIAGVQVRRRQQGAGQEESTFYADIVVDASGRNSRAPQWLVALGYVSPKETVINSFTGYATRRYKQSASLQDWQVLGIHHARSGVIYSVEDNQWVVTLAGVGQDYPPTDEVGFLDFARSLPVPHLYEAIKDAQPLSPIYGYRRTENVLRHYEQLKRQPGNFIVLGDAVCAFNPIYGQGMTASALAALTLDECLTKYRRRHPNSNFIGFAKSFQKRLAKLNATPWMMATSEDFRYPGTTGGQPTWLTRLLHKYMDQVLELSPNYPNIYAAFMAVVHLVHSPLRLFQPNILFPVIQQVARAIFQNNNSVNQPKTTRKNQL